MRWVVRVAALAALAALIAMAGCATPPNPDVFARAQSGDAEAQVELGRRYENGTGVVESAAQAAKWYRKAAAQGDADAQSSLGFMCSPLRGLLSQVPARHSVK
jgi:hypothetical protein